MTDSTRIDLMKAHIRTLETAKENSDDITARLLIAAKGVLSIVRNSYRSDDRGPGDKCSILEDAIKEAEGGSLMGPDWIRNQWPEGNTE